MCGVKTKEKKSKYRVGISLFLVLLLLGMTGCGYAAAPFSGDSGSGEEFTTLGLEPDFSYEIPVSRPSILVDQLGYAVGSSKVAILEGEDLGESFDVIEAQTGRRVYRGVIDKKGYDDITGSYISYGDFSEFDEIGEYYIRSEIVGRSYSFQIMENPYEELLENACKQYYLNRCGMVLSSEYAGGAAHNACHTREAQLKSDASVKLDVSGGWHMDENGGKNVVQGCQAINSLLMAYELYPGVFGDNLGIPESGNEIPDILDEIRYEVNWLLKMQDVTSGAVYASVSTVDNATGGMLLYVDGIHMDATIEFAATMAKFSYLYQNYDWDYANRCLKVADRAYRYAQQYLQDVEEEKYFYASTELYRATGAYGYQGVVLKYLSENPAPDMDNDAVFRGVTTYLATKQKVDVNLCNTMIKILLHEAEDISYASKASKLFVDREKGEEGCAGLLDDVIRLSVVDHIITNHEYTTVLENYLHYFLGRNLNSVSYLDNVGKKSYLEIDEKLGIMNQIDLNAELILVLSAVLDQTQN